jgi:hypothetical protein
MSTLRWRSPPPREALRTRAYTLTHSFNSSRIASLRSDVLTHGSFRATTKAESGPRATGGVIRIRTLKTLEKARNNGETRPTLEPECQLADFSASRSLSSSLRMIDLQEPCFCA